MTSDLAARLVKSEDIKNFFFLPPHTKLLPTDIPHCRRTNKTHFIAVVVNSNCVFGVL